MNNKQPATTYEEKIKRLDRALKKARDARTTALTSKQMLERDLMDLEKRCQELGVKPDELEDRIREIKEEMDRLLKEAEALIPPEFFNE